MDFQEAIDILDQYQASRMPESDISTKKRMKIMKKAHKIMREYMEYENCNIYIRRTFDNFFNTVGDTVDPRELTNAIEYLILQLKFLDLMP